MHITGTTSAAIPAIHDSSASQRAKQQFQLYSMAAPVEGLKLQTKTDLKRVNELVHEYEEVRA